MWITPEKLKALKTLRQVLPRAAQDLSLDLGDGFTHWRRTLDHKLLPRLHSRFPLVAAICGGGSTGKSTLFNTLVGQSVSPVGGRAGLNRRVLAAISKSQKRREALFDYLGRNFEGPPQRLESHEQLLEPGQPLYCESDRLPEQVVLLDTPDIDTGSKGRYTNRGMARQSLEVADVFLYIFTNATYNNLDNTDFIARMLTGMGTRPCFLIYRAYPGFSDEDVLEHARTVARNLYADNSDRSILGIYRADEDNDVAAGAKPMSLTPVSGVTAALDNALAALDPEPLRSGLMASMFEDAVVQARQMAARVHEAQTHLDRYARALETAQNQCVQAALSHFPTDRVLRRFARIWLESDPAHIKLMRGTGRVIEWPLKTVVRTMRRLKDPGRNERAPSSEEALAHQVETDLLMAANQLYQHSAAAHLALGTGRVTAPSLVQAAQARLAEKPWQATLQAIAAKKDDILSWSTRLDDDLRALADDLRRRMGLLDQIRQTFAAMLNVIPATAAVTYILHTGDPVGAAGIKVKLTGILGLHDLYALIAIPATAGMSKADRAQLEHMLGPLARTWLEHKLKVVQSLFEEQISGDILAGVRTGRRTASALTQEMDRALKTVAAHPERRPKP